MRPLWPASATELDQEALEAWYEPDRSRPWLRANFVSTLDGAAEVDGYSRGVGGGEPDQRVLRLLRTQADAVMVGAGTLRHEGYGAIRVEAGGEAWRVAHRLAPQPTLVIVSNSLNLDPAHKVFTRSPVRPVVLTRGGAPVRAVEELAQVAEVVRCGETVVDLAVGVAALHARGLTQILTEGGPSLFASLLLADLVDELCLSLSPLLAGAGATRIAAGVGLPAPRPMHPTHLLLAGNDVLFGRFVRADR